MCEHDWKLYEVEESNPWMFGMIYKKTVHKYHRCNLCDSILVEHELSPRILKLIMESEGRSEERA